VMPRSKRAGHRRIEVRLKPTSIPQSITQLPNALMQP
jgi:hypothetical protein